MVRTLRTLVSAPSVRVAAVVSLGLGAAAAGLPLLDAPGYDLGQLGALAAVLVLGPWLGLAAAQRQRARPEPSPLAAWSAASLLSATLLAALFAGAALRAAFGPCRALFAAAFFPVVALPSACLAAALAVAAGFAARGRRARAATLYAVAALLLLAARLLAAWRGPEAYLLDPLWGYFPGPLYDERVPLDARVLLGRTEALGWAAALAGLTEVLARRARGGRRRAGTALLAAGVVVAGAAWLARAAGQGSLGDLDPRAGIARALGARRDGARCTVFLPSEKPPAAAQELLDACEFHAADVAARLGIRAPPRVTVFVYRSPEEKRRLVGAARTDFTKPWHAELHVEDEPLPHPVLRHEIVHAVAGALAPGPLHVPARARVLPALTLVEGLAVALDAPRGAFTVHEWSRAARDLGYLPDLERILGPAGFWSQAPARAYTAAGSFLSWLLDRHGPEPIVAAYAHGDLARAFGRPLGALVREWHAFLDAVPVTPELTAAAARWFSTGSLFERRCAREAADLEARASAAAAEGRAALACGLYDRLASVRGGADALLAKGGVAVAAGELDAARAALDAADARIPLHDRARRAALATLRGDLAWRADDVPGALARWSEARAAGVERAEARLLEVKSAAAGDPAVGPALRAFLLTPRDPSGLLRAARADRPLAGYLAGRALLQRGERAAAAEELARALRGGLPPLTAVEARLSLAEARCAPEDAELLAPLADASDADRARLAVALRRCEWEGARRP
ncbi:MAG TPA: type VI secretion system protein [Anaeromyxobacter sp.]|nr:type VI secretion system protein [Anaeromyxobacter sp.]